MLFPIDQKLPEELLDKIITFTDRNALLTLCLTSKTFNRIATPYLYKHIYLKETDHLPALTYLMFTSPTHASLVKSLDVPDTWAKDEEKFTEWSWPSNIEEAELQSVLKRKCKEYGTNDNEADVLYEKIKSGTNEDAILACLLVGLPELRRLKINFYGSLRHEDFVRVWPFIVKKIRQARDLQHDANESHAYKKPRLECSPALSVPIDIMVMVTGDDDKYPHNPIHLAMFLHLPNLHSIYGWRIGTADGHPDAEINAFAKLQPQSCPVEYIELRTSKLHMDDFKRLLGATIPGKLKTFNYEVGCTWAWCNTEHPIIMKSLEPHHDTLECLALSHEDYYPYADGVAELQKPYPCSFTPFTALKRLKVAPVYIWGHEGFTDKARLENPRTKEMLWKALPSNLEELWITRAHQQKSDDPEGKFVPDCLLPALDLVIQNKCEASPNLKHLRIELPPLVWKTEWLDSLASLCIAASTNGIRSTIILFDMFDRYGKLAAERQWGWDEDIEWEPNRWSQNRESAKVWINPTAAEPQDLAQTLKELKERFAEERQKSKSEGVDLAELARFVESRPHAEIYWKRWDRNLNIVG